VIRLGTITTDIVQESEVVVVKIISDRCDSVMVDELLKSVYECNKDYAEPDEPVVVGVYSDRLPSDPRDLSREGRHLLAKNSDCKKYKFPITRLEPVEN